VALIFASRRHAHGRCDEYVMNDDHQVSDELKPEWNLAGTGAFVIDTSSLPGPEPRCS
jgi:hypothetical protein